MQSFSVFDILKINSAFYDAFYKKLVEDNEKFNLTAITDFEEVAYKHFIDSVFYADKFAAGANVVEIGSGAGFPSLPIAIERPDLNFTLVESNNKKCNFLNEVKGLLSLENVTVICDRAENVGKTSLRESFDYVIARAVAPMRALLEYAMPLIKVGGKCVFWKGDTGREELKESSNAIKLLGSDENNVKIYDYDIGSYGKRTIIEITKTAPTPPKYPRGLGKERKCPL